MMKGAVFFALQKRVLSGLLEQWFSIMAAQHPRVPPAQSRGYARSYTNATNDSIF